MTREIHNKDQELEQRVRRIMLLRVFFLTGFVGLLLTFQERLGITAPIEPLCMAIGAGFFMSLVYAVLFRFLTLTGNASLQVSGDLLLVGGILFTTGGIDSPISFLFLFVIIASSVMLPRAAAYLAASGAIIIYGVLVDLEYFGIITPVYLFPESKVSFESGYVFYVIFLNIVSYYTVAYLSSFLSHRLRMVKEELVRASVNLEEQRAFNRNIVQNMGNGLITTNPGGMITLINPAARTLTGYSIEESLEKPIERLIPLAEFKNLFSEDKKLVLPKQIKGEYQRKDGKIIIYTD